MFAQLSLFTLTLIGKNYNLHDDHDDDMISDVLHTMAIFQQLMICLMRHAYSLALYTIS